MIRNKHGLFNVGGPQFQNYVEIESVSGLKFDSLSQLIEHYKKNPMVETSGSVIHLKHPFHSTAFFPANIFQRVSELQEHNPDLNGKAGFWEEFQVCVNV